MVEVKGIALGELLTAEQGERVTELLNAKDKLRDGLEAKGVLASYLYYWLCYTFKLEEH